MIGLLPPVLVLAMTAASTGLSSRNLTDPEVNPGCNVDCDEPWLVVTTGVGVNNTLYHLWGARDVLSFLVVMVGPGLEELGVLVDWHALQNRSAESISFEKDPRHAFGFVIPSLILYNDPDDIGAFKNQNESLRIPVSDFTWSIEKLPEVSQQAAVMLQTTHFRGTSLPNDTRLLIQAAAYGEDGRSTVLPHLLRTPDSAQLDFIFENFTLNTTQETENWKALRWGMDIVVFSTEHTAVGSEGDAGIQFLTQKSLDDEHTPGVFNLDQITTAGARGAGNAPGGGYLQWRPVSYLSPERDITHATIPNINRSLPALTNLTDPLKASLAYAVLGENLTLPNATVTTILSFGQPNDGFYRAENYTTWTVALGEGSPPKETFSTLILIIITISVAIPSLMLLAGCVVLGVRRCYRRSSHRRLIDLD